MVHLTNLRFDVKFMHFSLQELRNELCDLTIIGDGGAGGCSKSLLCFLAEEKKTDDFYLITLTLFLFQHLMF